MSDTPPDKPDKRPDKQKNLFSILALLCLLVCLPAAMSAASRMDMGEDMTGYGGLGIAISVMVALLLSGVILGQIGLIRGEKPVFLPIGALAFNAIAFVVLLLHMPGG